MKILSKKKIDEILKRITANEIIAIETPMDVDKHTYMTENNADIAYLVGGIKGMTKVQNTIKNRYKDKKYSEV